MKTVYNIYFNGQQINSVPLRYEDVQKIKAHDTISKIDGRRVKEIPVRNVQFIKRILI